MTTRIGIIGGSGLYDMEGLTDVVEEPVDTPFGPPSDALVHGRLGEAELVFLPRHGRGHRLTPSEVPYRANVWALKQAGVGWVISVSAVGSLAEAIVPGHVVLVDQFVDRTRGRAATFFGNGVVAHVQLGDPVCETLRCILRDAARDAGASVHDGGTYVCIEGPAFSTRAESRLYRSWGADVVGMTNLTEAKLAREAELSYATLAMSTDYDCWFEGHDEVSTERIVEVMTANVALAKRILALAVPRIAAHPGPPPMHEALKDALLTRPDAIPAARARELHLLLGKYLT